MTSKDVQAERHVSAVGSELDAMAHSIANVHAVRVRLVLEKHAASPQGAASSNCVRAEWCPAVCRVRNKLQRACAFDMLNADSQQFFIDYILAESVFAGASANVDPAKIVQVNHQRSAAGKIVFLQRERTIELIGANSRARLGANDSRTALRHARHNVPGEDVL